LTESQVINLLEYGKTATNKPFEHHQMVSDHYQAMQFIVGEAVNKRLLSPTFLQEIGAKVMHSTGSIYKHILGDFDVSKGEFRLVSVRAGTRAFPDAKKVPALITQFCEEVNLGLQTVQTLQEKCNLAFKAHFGLVSIHPFGDGNGRTSRLITNYIQAYFGLPLSTVFKQDRIKYINALESARKKDSLQPFLEFMMRQYGKFLKEEIKKMESL
jgi:Fic family protein